MKKGIVMLMIAAMAVGATAGCGGSNSAASDNTSSSNGTSTEATSIRSFQANPPVLTAQAVQTAETAQLPTAARST